MKAGTIIYIVTVMLVATACGESGDGKPGKKCAYLMMTW